MAHDDGVASIKLSQLSMREEQQLRGVVSREISRCGKRKACRILAAAGSIGSKQPSCSQPVSSPTLPFAPLQFSFALRLRSSALVSALDRSPLPIALAAPAPFSAARLPI
jgi:hypothetical protein